MIASPIKFGAVVTGNLATVPMREHARLALVDGISNLKQQYPEINLDVANGDFDLFGVSMPDELLTDAKHSPHPVVEFLHNFGRTFGLNLQVDGTDSELEWITRQSPQKQSFPWKVVLGIAAAAIALMVIAKGLFSGKTPAEPPKTASATEAA